MKSIKFVNVSVELCNYEMLIPKGKFATSASGTLTLNVMVPVAVTDKQLYVATKLKKTFENLMNADLLSNLSLSEWASAMGEDI